MAASIMFLISLPGVRAAASILASLKRKGNSKGPAAGMVRRAREIGAGGIKEVILFHSSAQSIRSHQKDIPFLMTGDPNKLLYKEFGVETSLRFLNLRALGAALRGMMHGHFALRLSDGPLGLPADFLIAPSGQIKALKYGTDAYDQWSVDELLALAKGVTLQAV
jgi:hypothetical protein